MDVLRAQNRAMWRDWLRDNHDKSTKIWLLFYKKHAGKVSVTYDEAVEEALCYGWIDSIIRRVDQDSYAQMFTPRKAGSRWSPSNLTRMKKLIADGKVSKRGMDAYLGRSKQKPDRERLKALASRVPEDLETALRSNGRAWRNFQGFPPSHRREYVLWIISAKRPETRKRQIVEAVRLIEKNAKQVRE